MAGGRFGRVAWAWAALAYLSLAVAASDPVAQEPSTRSSQTIDLMAQPPQIAFAEPRFREATSVSDVYDLLFPSAVVTEYAENNQVPVHLYLPRERSEPVPVVILLHFWGATDLKAEEALARMLNERRVGALVMELPYHLNRAPAGTRSGELALAPDVELLKATARQAVWDVKRLIDWIDSRPDLDDARIGIAGTSLGAVISALVYSVEPRIKVSAFLLGGVDLAHILWNSSRVVSQREALRKQGYTESVLREALADIEPQSRIRARTDGAALVIGARFDSVMPPAAVEKLAEATPNAQVSWLETGHYGGIVIRDRLLGVVAAFLGETLYGRHYEAPPRITAPTFRIGVPVDPRDGVQVAIGVDLWRNTPQGEAYASAMFTPRGPQLFVGRRLDRSLAIGVFVKPKSTTFGLFWSVVL